jgi:ribosomal protein L23
MKKLSKLQQKLQATGQLKARPNLELEDNSVMIEKMKEQQPTEENVIMTIQPYEEKDELEKTVEEFLASDIEEVELEPEKVLKPMDLMKLRKTQLLSMANTMGCEVTSKNTKRQIVAAIEKQSA